MREAEQTLVLNCPWPSMDFAMQDLYASKPQYNAYQQEQLGLSICWHDLFLICID